MSNPFMPGNGIDPKTKGLPIPDDELVKTLDELQERH